VPADAATESGTAGRTVRARVEHHSAGGSIGWRFAEWGSLRYRNALPVFNLAAIHWIGVVDMNTALLGIHLGHVMLEIGPSLDVFSVPLCADTGCQREHGLAPAGHLDAVLLPAPTSSFAAGAPIYLSLARHPGGPSAIAQGACAPSTHTPHTLSGPRQWMQ
jgi:hypothetical protein